MQSKKTDFNQASLLSLFDQMLTKWSMGDLLKARVAYARKCNARCEGELLKTPNASQEEIANTRKRYAEHHQIGFSLLEGAVSTTFEQMRGLPGWARLHQKCKDLDYKIEIQNTSMEGLPPTLVVIVKFEEPYSKFPDAALSKATPPANKGAGNPHP
jgi:hypothetical protein